jgi:peptidyl-prolyl cis-trans isomerase SurA
MNTPRVNASGPRWLPIPGCIRTRFRRVCWLCGLALWVSQGPTLAQVQLVNGFAAVVNNKVITFNDIESAVRPGDRQALLLQFGRQPQADAQELARLKQDALIGLIETELILSEFESAGYRLPESVIEEQINARIRGDYGDRARLILTLQAQNLNLETFRQQIRERFIVEVMTAKHVSSAFVISPYKIESYYNDNLDRFRFNDRVRLRLMSLWNRPDRGPEATRKLAREIHDRLTAGTPFAELATVYSEDSYRREGGNRDWIERDSTNLRPDLLLSAFSLTPGQPSEVIEKDDGCFLMLVEEYQPAHVQPLNAVRDEIEQTLDQRERSRLRDQWIKRLRDKSYVRIFAN